MTRNPPAGRGLLAVVGAINWDVSIFEDRFARPGEEVPVRMVEEYSGGKGANVAVAASRVLGPRRVTLVGALGDDEISGTQLAALRDEGVLTDGIAVLKGRRSGRAYVVVDGEGRKTIHTHFGANNELLPGHVTDGAAADALSRSSIAVVMDPPVPVALQAVKASRKGGSKVIYSPGVRTQEGLGSIGDVIGMSDMLVLDSNELKNLCGTGDLESGIVRLRRGFPDVTVVATLGPQGCTVARRGVTSRVEGVDLRALGLKAVNSTGSGDAFLGVFSSYLLRGRSALEAVTWGNLAGALKATRYETRGSPRGPELEASMKKLEAFTRRRQGSRGNRAS
jgi:ribokinase